MRRLNLGAGRDIRPASEGWVNADIRALEGIDVVCDARGPLPFDDGEFSELLAYDLIEHLPPADVGLSEWRRVLCDGGILKLRLPDLLKIALKVRSGALSEEEFVLLVYGDQSPEAGGTEWGSHKWAYTPSQIKALLESNGFSEVTVGRHETEFNLYVTAVKA